MTEMLRLMLALTIFVIQAEAGSVTDDKVKFPKVICNTVSCQKLADRLHQSMDKKIRPCDDFYKFVCGNYEKNGPLPEGSDSVTIRDETVNTYKEKMIEALKKQVLTDQPIIRKTKWLFDSCLDKDALNNMDLLPLDILFKKIRMQFKPPVIGKISDPIADLGEPLARIRRFVELQFPFNIAVNLDRDNRKWNQLQILVPKLAENSVVRLAPEEIARLELERLEIQSAIARLNTSPPPTPRTGRKRGRTKLLRTNSMINLYETTGPLGPTLKRSQSDVGYNRTGTMEAHRLTRPYLAVREVDAEQRNKSRAQSGETITNNIKPPVCVNSKQKKSRTMDLKGETEALGDFMMRVARAIYDYLHMQVIDSKQDQLRSKFQRVAEIMHNVEKLTANVTRDASKERRFSVQQLQKKSVDSNGKIVINWVAFIKTLFKDNTDISQQLLDGKREIFIEDINYYNGVIKLLSALDSKDLYSTLWWAVVRTKIRDTTDELAQFEEQYRREVGLPEKPREEYCLEVVTDIFHLAVAYQIMEGKRMSRLLKKANDMVGYLEDALLGYVQDALKLDMKTFMAAGHKLNSAEKRLGFENKFLDLRLLDKTYQNLIVHNRNFFYTRLLHDYTKFSSQLQSIGRENPLDSKGRYPNPLSTQIQTSNLENAILVPLSLMQYPFYNHDIEAFNYGMFGASISREMYRLIAGEGSMYSSSGMKERWWKKRTLKEYSQTTKCFAESYEKILHYKPNKNNYQTYLDEIVADSVAFDLTFRGYETLLMEMGDSRLVKFESLSPEMLFTIAYAQMFCERNSPTAILQHETKRLPPASVRVNGVVMNSPHFSYIWECKPHKPMNSAQKCTLEPDPPSNDEPEMT